MTKNFREPLFADEVITPANLPPSAASLTTKGRSLFNEILKAIKMRQRTNYSRLDESSYTGASTYI